MLSPFAFSSVFPKKRKKKSLNATHTDGFHSIHRLRGYGEMSSEMGGNLAKGAQKATQPRENEFGRMTLLPRSIPSDSSSSSQLRLWAVGPRLGQPKESSNSPVASFYVGCLGCCPQTPLCPSLRHLPAVMPKVVVVLKSFTVPPLDKLAGLWSRRKPGQESEEIH